MTLFEQEDKIKLSKGPINAVPFSERTEKYEDEYITTPNRIGSAKPKF